MKRDTYVEALRPLLADKAGLELFLTRHSGLPGPRADLELAAAFAIVAAAGGARDNAPLLLEWAAIPPGAAPTNHPREFVVFAAVVALGAIYGESSGAERDRIALAIRGCANDPRWRTREAAAMGLQQIGERDPTLLCALVSEWLRDATLLEQRAILAGLAHPPILQGAVADLALRTAEAVLAGLPEQARDLNDEEPLRVVKKGLEYALSVFTAAAPKDGFRLLERLARSPRLDVKRIVAANLRKSRLAKQFPEECTEVAEQLAIWDS